MKGYDYDFVIICERVQTPSLTDNSPNSCRSLGSMLAKIVVECKAIMVFYIILQTGCDFDEERFRKDIIRPHAT